MMLSRLATAWASPDEPEMTVRPKNKVSCAACKAVYTVQTIGNEKTRALSEVIPVHETGLTAFSGMFPGHEFNEVHRLVTAAVQPDADTLNIFFVLDGKRYYLVCGRTRGRFVVVGTMVADR